jgi:hypothetical protein
MMVRREQIDRRDVRASVMFGSDLMRLSSDVSIARPVASPA